MHLVRLLLGAHLAVSSALLVLLAVVVCAQALARACRGAEASTADAAAQPTGWGAVPATGASVLEWTVDLRGVGQHEAVART